MRVNVDPSDSGFRQLTGVFRWDFGTSLPTGPTPTSRRFGDRHRNRSVLRTTPEDGVGVGECVWFGHDPCFRRTPEEALTSGSLPTDSK